MSLNGGLNTDIQPYHQPKNSWRHAKNILISKGFNSITNEEGFNLHHTVTDKTIIGIVKTTNDLIIFSTDDTTSEIGIIEDNGNYVKVIESIHLGFLKENPIEGVTKRNFREELIVAWCDGLNDSATPPRLLNLTNLPFVLDGNLEFVTSANARLTYLNPDIEIPKISLSSFIDGGFAPQGATQFAIAYNYINNDRTNFLVLSNPVSNDSDTKSIILQVSNLDTSFGSFKLVAINRLATETNVIEIGDFPISDTIEYVNYSGQSFPTTLTIEDVIIPTNTFERVHTMTTLKDELILGNVKTKAINYQCYANNIKVKWEPINLNTTTSGITSDDTTKKEYYKEEFRQAHYRTFMPNEVYALYISWIFNDGSTTDAFHIPGREAIPQPERTTVEILALPSPQNGDESKNSDTGTYWVYLAGWLDTGVFIIVTRTVGTVPYYNITVGNEVEVFITYDSGIPATANSIVMASPFNIYQTYYIDLNGTRYNVKKYETISGDINTNIITFKVTLDTDPNTFTEPSVGVYEFFDLNDYLGEDKLLINIIPSSRTTTQDELIENNYLTSNFHIKETADKTTGTLGFWKNLNETYGNNDNSKICDETGAIIGDLSGQNVRHHKMPNNISVYTRATQEGIITNLDANQIVFGLRLEDVAIPAELIGKVKGYTLNYAKKDTSNQTVMGQSIAVKTFAVTNDIDDPDSLRWYPKELLEFQPTFKSDFYKVDLYQDQSAISAPSTSLQEAHTIPDTVVYKPLGSAGGNPEREPHVQISDPGQSIGALIGGSVSGNIGSNPPVYANTWNFPIISLHKVVTDIFSPYYEQSLASTNTINYIEGAIQLENSEVIFGGDTFIRSEDIYINTDNQTVPPDYDRYVVHQEIFTYISPRYVSPDPLFNSVNDLQSPSVFNPKYAITDKLPFTVFRSIKDFNESLTVGWRTFLANNFYTMPRNKGEIWELETLNRTLLIQHKFALFSATIKDVLKADNITSYLGEGDIFDRTPDEIAPEDNGYIGCQSKFAAFTCKLGYVTVDRNQGKIFIYSGQGIDEISAKGLRNFFRDSLETTEDIDNPFIEMGISACYDEKYNRLIISKNINKTAGSGKYDVSYTVSYSTNINQGKGGWVSFHDYITNYLINTRDEVYSIANLGEIYKHNIESKKAIFYGATTYQSFADVVFLGNTRETKIWEAVLWNSSIIQADNTKLRNKTITHILIYNDYQCSGVIEINKNESWFLKNASGDDEQWFFNTFKDIVKDTTLPFIDSNNELILTNLSEQISWINKNKFIGKFGIVRFIHDNSSQNDFYLNDASFKNRVFDK